jgi:hypothetical protein
VHRCLLLNFKLPLTLCLAKHPTSKYQSYNRPSQVISVLGLHTSITVVLPMAGTKKTPHCQAFVKTKRKVVYVTLCTSWCVYVFVPAFMHKITDFVVGVILVYSWDTLLQPPSIIAMILDAPEVYLADSRRPLALPCRLYIGEVLGAAAWVRCPRHCPERVLRCLHRIAKKWGCTGL